MKWQWETEDSVWGVEFKEKQGILEWSGYDKPRADLPYWALGAGGKDQEVSDFLNTGKGAYDCPEEILVEVRARLLRDHE